MDLGYLRLYSNPFKILVVSNTVNWSLWIRLYIFFNETSQIFLCRESKISYISLIFRHLVLARPLMLLQHLSLVLWTARQSNYIKSIISTWYTFLHLYMEPYLQCYNNYLLKSLQNMTHTNDFFEGTLSLKKKITKNRWLDISIQNDFWVNFYLSNLGIQITFGWRSLVHVSAMLWQRMLFKVAKQHKYD